MDADAARLATSPAALALLATMPPYDAAGALALTSQLRAQGADPALVSTAMTQARLRAAATAKFGPFAQGMLFTQDGLEQATRLAVSAHHAQRYVKAGITSVADLTCGLGADAMAFASLGLSVLAFERDEATALLADHNLRHWEDARVVFADAMVTLAAGPVDAQSLFVDPARRDGRGRHHDPRDYSPPLDDVLALRARWPDIGLKLGPALPHDAVPPESEAQWVSVDGDVVELGVWSGRLARRHGHSALVMRGSQSHTFDADPVQGEAGPLGEYLYEPDGAIIRAGLVGPLADHLGARLIDPHIAYLTCDSPVETPFATGFRILDSLPYSEKRLASALASRGIGRLEIKKRGMDIDPAALRPRLKLKGSAAATVILTRVGDTRLALIAERVS